MLRIKLFPLHTVFPEPWTHFLSCEVSIMGFWESDMISEKEDKMFYAEVSVNELDLGWKIALGWKIKSVFNQ